MIRRLTILLLIVGCAYGYTIVYKSGSKNRTIENVEYTKAGKGKVYFKAYDREVSRDCRKVVTFTDNVGNPIEYDCSAVIIEESVILDESIIEKVKTSESENYLISSGQKLIKFQSKYYRGFMIALFGQVITIVGATSTRLARAEGMEAHARTVDIRLKKYGHSD